MRPRYGRRAYMAWAALVLGVLLSFLMVACNPGEGGNATGRPTSVPRP